MAEKIEAEAKSPKSSRAALERLQELEKHLSSGSDGELLSSSSLARSLFGKAPHDFLTRKTLDDLVQITNASAACVAKLAQEKQGKLVVQSTLTDDAAQIFIALGDRPFIVNTIRECLIESHASFRVHLHPILLGDPYRISCSYIELDPLEASDLAELEKTITHALEDLFFVTEDFSPMLVRAETLARLLENPRSSASFAKNERDEIASLIRWLIDGSFVFLGHAELKLGKNDALEREPGSVLGLFKSPHLRQRLLDEVQQDSKRLVDDNQLFTFTRLSVASTVHRRVRINTVLVQELSSEGRVIAVHAFAGLLTSKALAEESSSVPVIRQKLKKVLEIEGPVENSHDYKYIVDIVDSMPKEDALRLSDADLAEIAHTILQIQSRSDTRVSFRVDPEKRSISVLTVMPRERLNSEVRQGIQEYLEKAFHAEAGSSEYHLDLSNKPLARFYLSIPLTKSTLPKLDDEKIKADIKELTRTWQDNLRDKIFAASFSDPETTWEAYQNAFPDEYQALQTVEECVHDIMGVEQLSEQNPIHVGIPVCPTKADQSFSIIVYSLGTEMTVSRVLPVLEHAGLEVITERSACIRPVGWKPVYIYRLLSRLKAKADVDTQTFQQFLAPGLREVLLGRAVDDSLNALLVAAKLDSRAISLLRTYAGLCFQLSKLISRDAIYLTLAALPSSARQLWGMFDVKFNPKLSMTPAQRAEKFEELRVGFYDSLRSVSDIAKDKILRTLTSLLENTVRTNFFRGSPAIAIKIRSEKVEFMPQPRPLFEIFINAPIVEGVHLRSGKVARGGIRWSDRADDFRSEVLGLMKTQKVKNVVIVPTGAKGGFIVRNLPTDRAKVAAAVADAYKEFIRALLSITDNRKGDAIVHPPELIIYDEADPYFVVAADKGTATFSDIANKIAVEEYDFWLGDAFASGGSQGYDHKLYGITAKGAWECVKRHFNDLGIDMQKPFTAVGIGDMAGDVFGNGMLLSDKLKLLGAFNHKHIFLDPSPDPAKSFAERKRLFETPGTQWSDYDPALISKGGGVFGRFDKEIPLTPEVRAALSIPSDVPSSVNGEQLISLILKANVDLLWNGGIGTYVKSSAESQADVDDGTNDRVRVNADELRARVVGEGGNLGFTQRARIEFAERGGRLNTDAIDNSGGVDLSDHEVNLKILFAGLLRDKKITLEERNKLLKEMAPTVLEDVLEHNRTHALLLTSSVKRSSRHLEYYRSLLKELVKLGYVNRALEQLPDDEDLVERIYKKTGLTSPELAVCVAIVKMWVTDTLLRSDIVKDPLLHQFLLNYFPPELRTRFSREITAHPLAANIIATQVTNVLLDNIGITFLHRMCTSHGATPTVAIKSALAAYFILEVKSQREAVLSLDTVATNKEYIQSVQEIGRSLRDAAARLMSYHGKEQTLSEIVNFYQDSYQTLTKHAEDVLAGEEKEIFNRRLALYRSFGIADLHARHIACSPRVLPIFEMLWCARDTKRDVKEVASVLSQVMETTALNALLRKERVIETSTKWENDLLIYSYDEIRRAISRMTKQLLSTPAAQGDSVDARLRKSPSFEGLKTTIDEMTNVNPGVAALSVLGKQLSAFAL